jgi:hypothetical protein
MNKMTVCILSSSHFTFYNKQHNLDAGWELGATTVNKWHFAMTGIQVSEKWPDLPITRTVDQYMD